MQLPQINTLPVQRITYLQADHVYVKIHLRQADPILVRTSLTALLAQLDKSRFVRVHRSYAINLAALRQFNSKEVYVDNQPIPVGRAWRKNFYAHLQQLDIA
ncbi:MAG: LytTR family DNA-binding domain-containing protein [Bacteroidota bacterium]